MDPVHEELSRLAGRWRQLPLGQAVSYAGLLRALAQDLFDQVAAATGGPSGRVGDLGPAAALDQLTVAVHDAVAAGLTAGLAGRLTELRRGLV